MVTTKEFPPSGIAGSTSIVVSRDTVASLRDVALRGHSALSLSATFASLAASCPSKVVAMLSVVGVMSSGTGVVSLTTLVCSTTGPAVPIGTTAVLSVEVGSPLLGKSLSEVTLFLDGVATTVVLHSFSACNISIFFWSSAFSRAKLSVSILTCCLANSRSRSTFSCSRLMLCWCSFRSCSRARSCSSSECMRAASSLFC